jgi:hypothetical protein
MMARVHRALDRIDGRRKFEALVAAWEIGATHLEAGIDITGDFAFTHFASRFPAEAQAIQSGAREAFRRALMTWSSSAPGAKPGGAAAENPSFQRARTDSNGRPPDSKSDALSS